MPLPAARDASAVPGLARRAGWLGVVALVVACAREEPPPGTHPDTRPPEVREIRPEPGAVVPEMDGDVRVRFDEPVNVAQDLEARLEASPAYRYRVTAGFSDVRIRPEEGWRQGVVYCFGLPSGIPDLLGNRTDEPVEFCFSTGPTVPETEVTGRLLDRTTGRAVATSGRVLFYALEGDTVPYTAVPDGEGAFRGRGLPPDTYRVFGFVDRNRNRRLDRTLEPHDSATVVLEGQEASAEVELAVVEPDSTPPVLGAAAALDSVTLRLELDDPLPPEQTEAATEVVDSETGRRWPVASVRVGEPEDGGAPGPVGRDTLVEPAGRDTLPEPAGERAEEGEAPPPGPGRGLPSTVVTVRLAEPLAPGSYAVRLSGVRNLRGLEGGGEASFNYAPDAGRERP